MDNNGTGLNDVTSPPVNYLMPVGLDEIPWETQVLKEQAYAPQTFVQTSGGDD